MTPCLTRRRFMGFGMALVHAGKCMALVSTTGPLLTTTVVVDSVGRLLVPVFLNGHGPFRFVVDTGASQSAISSQLTAQLTLAPTPGADVLIHGTTGQAMMPSVLIEQFEIGSLRIEHQRLPIVASHLLAGAVGILGVDVLAGKRLDIDFRNKWLTIGMPAGADDDRNLTVVPAQQKFGGLLSIDCRVGNVRCRAIIDTGAQKSLGNPALLNRLHRGGAEPTGDEASVVRGPDGVTTIGRMLSDLPVRIGRSVALRTAVIFADAPVFRTWGLADEPALLIGMDLLGTLSRLVIDYRRGILLLQAR